MEIDEEKELKEFGQRLHDLRTEKDYSYNDLEQISDVIFHCRIPKPLWQRYELGKTEPKLTNIKKIASIYGVSADYLVGLTDSRKGRYNSNKPLKADVTAEESTIYKKYESATPEKKRLIRYALGIRQKTGGDSQGEPSSPEREV